MNKNTMMATETVKISQLVENKENPSYITKPAFEEDYTHTFEILTEAGYNCLPKD